MKKKLLKEIRPELPLAYENEWINVPAVDIINKSKQPTEEELLKEIKNDILEIQDIILQILADSNTSDPVIDYFSNNENVRLLMKDNPRYEFYRNRKKLIMDKNRGEIYGYG